MCQFFLHRAWEENQRDRVKQGVTEMANRAYRLTLRTVRFLLPLAILSFVASPVWAHKISVFGAVQGERVLGEACYRDGTPVRDARVTIMDPAGAKLGETKTDSDGRFAFRPTRRCDHRIVVDVGDGHMSEYTIRADEIPSGLPERSAVSIEATPAVARLTDSPKNSSKTTFQDSRPDSPPDSRHDSRPAPAPDQPPPQDGSLAQLRGELEAIQAQIVALRRDLAANQDRARWSDVLGGIGYIVGLAGLASYFLGKHSRARQGAEGLEMVHGTPARRFESPP